MDILPRLSWQKVVVWAVFLAVLFILRHLFAVIFLTFIFSYIGNSLVNLALPYTKSRRVTTVAVFGAALVILSAVVGNMIPAIYREGTETVRELAARAGPAPEAAVDSADVTPGLPGDPAVRTDSPPPEAIDRIQERIEAGLESLLGPERYRRYRDEEVFERILRQAGEKIASLIPLVAEGVRIAIGSLFLAVLYLVISAILSFLIVWDMPHLSEGVKVLGKGRFAGMYETIAPGLLDFGRLLGKAFQAQAMIAVCNTVLTAVGLLVLGIPSVALLSTVVFFGSFVPVLGVMLSTVPIFLIALKAQGIWTALASIGMVLIVHGIETYILNPAIYGRTLHMHPILVLIILIIAEHLVGVWGLILGVPVAMYVFEYVIQGKTGWPPRFREEKAEPDPV